MDGLATTIVEGGKTELEAANTPNMDALRHVLTSVASFRSVWGHPRQRTGSPGAFCYDPVKYEIGRGVLSRLVWILTLDPTTWQPR